MNLLALLAGAFTWTFLEYVIHRFLGHWRPRNPFGREHVTHHNAGDYFAPWYKKTAAAAAVSALLLPPCLFLLGASGGAFLIGIIASWILYEVIHRLEHVTRGIGSYGRWARRHHFYHHFHDPKMNHGVTTPLWDLVFGTYVRYQGPIEVPEKLAMRWVYDPATRDVPPPLAGQYRIRRHPSMG